MCSDIRILLVDDFEVNQKIARQHLHKGGYTVDLAANGQQAVEAFKQNRYDLILMDIDMPVMDGYEAANSIRKIEENQLPHAGTAGHATAKSIPIIAMSGNAAAGEDAHSSLPGMDDCICKPFRRAELLEIVKKWIAGPQDTMNCKEIAGDCLPPDEPMRDPQAPLDLKKALQEFMGKEGVLADVLRSFVTNGKECIKLAQEALLADDYKRIQSQAHKLGGGAANLTAQKLADAAFALENAVQHEKLFQVRPLLQEFEQEFCHFETYLRQNAMISSIEE
jgi:CheY-like chemotaxis protein/HPt (histidine-containing phosphotransfer) domain-containing protein